MIKKIIFIVFCMFLMTKTPFAADARTLIELRSDLRSLQNEKAKKDSTVRYTKGAINAKKNDITNAYNNIEIAEENIAVANQNIEKGNIKLSEYTQKAKELMIYYEVLNNSDAYYEYVTSTSSMAELIMRQDAIDLLINHSKKNLEEIEKLIEDNKKQEIELKKQQKVLAESIIIYENSLKKLSYDLSSLVEITENIEDQIKNQKALIDYYVSIGCKEDQDLSQCETVANNRGWLKPLVKARVTSAFGYRKDPITGKAVSFHNGIDLGIGEGTPVYSATAGKVAAITVRSDCGGNKVYIYSKVNGENYTLSYLHLLRIDVKVGDTVTTETRIGTVGGYTTGTRYGGYDRCTTGAHLHFGVAKGFYLTEYKAYSTYLARSINPPGFPREGVWFYARNQWF